MPLTFAVGISEGEAEPSARRLRVDDDVQQELSELFEQQATRFVHDEDERVTFRPRSNYRSERGEVFILPNIPLPAAFENAAIDPHLVGDLHLRTAARGENRPNITTIFGADVHRRQVNNVYFQAFRRTQFLDRRLALFENQNVFNRVNNDGLSLANELVAIWRNGTLLFHSFAMVSRIFDLSAFEPEATPEEVGKFMESEFFSFENDEERISLFNMISGDAFLRRRIASIQTNDILSNVTTVKARNKGTAFGITITTRVDHGKHKLALPRTKKELKQIVKFLNEEFFHGELTNATYRTNSLQ